MASLFALFLAISQFLHPIAHVVTPAAAPHHIVRPASYGVISG